MAETTEPNDPAQQPGAGRDVARWRWWVHLVLLALYPLLLGLLGYFVRQDGASTLLPRDVRGLFLLSAQELVFFGLLFGAAWLVSRVNGRQLLLHWRGIFRPFFLGFVDSI